MDFITLDNSVAFLGFLPLAISFVSALKKGKYIDSNVIQSFIIGLFIFILTIADHNKKNSLEVINKKHSDSLDKQIKRIQDSLSAVKDTFIAIGLRIDSNTGKILVTDSLILKKGILKIVNYNTNFFNDNKPFVIYTIVDSAFDALKDPIRKETSINTILSYFPASLSESKIKQLINYNTPIANPATDMQLKVCNLLAAQKKPNINIENYFKDHVLPQSGSYLPGLPTTVNQIVWTYLFRKDVNVGLPFIISFLKNGKHNDYVDIIIYAIKFNNRNVALSLLNNKGLSDPIILNIGEHIDVQTLKYHLDKIIDSIPAYKIYKGTYLYKGINKL